MNFLSWRSAELHSNHTRFFVYGTLKRGQCRQVCWPRAPRKVSAAWTLGRLFDLGPYPAMLPAIGPPGTAPRVLGEIWEFAPEYVDEVIRVLDEIEGTHVPGEPNEYDRVTVEVHTFDGQPYTAHAYFFARPIDEGLLVATDVRIGDQLYAGWPVA